MNKFLQRLALFIILCYQKLISPFLAHRCRFWPSCSAYAFEAFELWGFFRGMFLTTKRLLKCHPFHKGGVDLVPPCKQIKA